MHEGGWQPARTPRNPPCHIPDSSVKNTVSTRTETSTKETAWTPRTPLCHTPDSSVKTPYQHGQKREFKCQHAPEAPSFRIAIWQPKTTTRYEGARPRNGEYETLALDTWLREDPSLALPLSVSVQVRRSEQNAQARFRKHLREHVRGKGAAGYMDNAKETVARQFSYVQALETQVANGTHVSLVAGDQHGGNIVTV